VPFVVGVPGADDATLLAAVRGMVALLGKVESALVVFSKFTMTLPETESPGDFFSNSRIHCFSWPGGHNCQGKFAIPKLPLLDPFLYFLASTRCNCTAEFGPTLLIG